jgi:outer membrane immunogenic protein
MTPIKTLAIGLASAAAIAAAVGSASAADIEQSERFEDNQPGTYPLLWSGFYVGLNLGAAFEDAEEVEILEEDAVFAGGGHFGYNWQTQNNLVLGVEGDIGAIEDIAYLATLRGRVGYAFGPTLIYGTGGAAFFGLNDAFNDGETDVGYVAGGGIERKVLENVSIGLEGLYYSFEDEATEEEANFWTARARVSFQFDNLF